MNAVEQLTEHLLTLPETERERIAEAILEAIKTLNWDRQIEADALAGRLDQLIREAKEDHRAGRTTPLPS